MTCSICCNKYTPVKRAQVNCTRCKESACKECYSRYFKDHSTICMYCENPFPQMYLMKTFPKKVINIIINQSVDELFKRELGLIKQTMNKALIQKKRKEIDIESHSIVRDIETIRDDIIDLEASVYQYPEREEEIIIGIQEFYMEIMELEMQLSLLNISLFKYRHELNESTFNVKCINANCNGLLNKGTCGICKVTVCYDCNEPNVGGHVCNPDTKATFTELKKTSKVCPGCNAMTFHEEGCSQMWCTLCHCTWDWNTHEPVTERIHNPMYYEWLRETSTATREIGDYVSGGLPLYEEIEHCAGFQEGLGEFMYQLAEIEDEIIPGLLAKRAQNDNFEKERIDYIFNKITPIQFKNIIKQRYRNSMILTEEIGILNSYLICVYEVYLRINNIKEVNPEHLMELESLSLIFAEQEELIYQIYNSSIKHRNIQQIVF